jgi:hypothetical protein
MATSEQLDIINQDEFWARTPDEIRVGDIRASEGLAQYDEFTGLGLGDQSPTEVIDSLNNGLPAIPESLTERFLSAGDEPIVQVELV